MQWGQNMDNQHRVINGYRELNQDEIDAINTIKELGNELEKVIQHLPKAVSVDERWLHIAATDLQTGIMALVRSVAQPSTF